MPDTMPEWLATIVLCAMLFGVRLYHDAIQRERQRQLRRQWKRDAPKRSRHRLWLREQRDTYRKALAEADPDGPPVPLPAAFGGPRTQA